jgi:hypothetical protein
VSGGWPIGCGVESVTDNSHQSGLYILEHVCKYVCKYVCPHSWESSVTRAALLGEKI